MVSEHSNPWRKSWAFGLESQILCKIPDPLPALAADRPYSSSASARRPWPSRSIASSSGSGANREARPVQPSLSGYGGGPNRCLAKVPDFVPGKIPKPASISRKITKSMVRYEAVASDPTAVWRIVSATNYKADVGQHQSVGRSEPYSRPSEEPRNLHVLIQPRERELEMARSAEDLRQITLKGTQGKHWMGAPEGNFNPPTGHSAAPSGWGQNQLLTACLVSPNLNHLNPSHGPELAKQCSQYPRELRNRFQFQDQSKQWDPNPSNKRVLSVSTVDDDLSYSNNMKIEQTKVKAKLCSVEYQPRRVPGKEILEQEVYGIDPYTHNLPKEIVPADLDWSIDDKAEEKKGVNESGDEDKINKDIAVKTNFVMADVPDEAKFYLTQLYMVGRDDRWLWSTGLLWKPPPWPDFCAMGCDSVAQHGGYEVLVNFHSVKKYHISLDKAFEFNDYCRSHQPPISLIKAEVCGLLGSVFCDFGPEFTVLDVEGEDPHTGIIASISNDNPALISCVDDERLEFQNGDLVVFSEVQGMTELHDSKEGPANVCVIELGGTIGDIEHMNFVDALGQFSYRVGAANFCLVHVSLVPVLNVVGEQKTKPTQRSVQGLRGLVLTPNILACCSIKELEENVKEKLSQFCHVPASNIFTLYDVSNIRRIPLLLWDQKAHVAIHEDLSLESIAWEPNLEEWVARATLYDTLQDTIRIAMVGKYTSLSDSYLSVLKALLHASVACHIKLVVDWVVRIWDPETGSKNMKWQSSPLGVVGGITFGAVSAAGKAHPEDLALKVESALYSAGVAKSFCTGQIGKLSFWSQGISQDSPVGTDEFMSFKKPTRLVLRMRMIALKLEFGAFHNQVFERTIAVHSTNPFHISKNVVDKCNGWFAPVAMVGLGQFIKKNATLTYAKEVDACLIRAMKFFVFYDVCVAVQCKVTSDIPPACRKFEALGKVDPMVLCTTEESGEHIITGAGELYLEICLKDLLKMLHKYPFSVLQKIGNIAYQLQLPDGVGVHVSQLKKHCGPTVVPSPDLPLISKDGKIRTEPIAVLEPIALPRKYRLVTQWLVQWEICFQKRLHEKMLISSRLYSQTFIHTQLNLGFQIIILEDKYALEGKEMSDTAMTEELAIEVKSEDTAWLVSDQLRWTAEM